MIRDTVIYTRIYTCLVFVGWMPRSWLATFLQVAGMIGRIVLGRPPVLVFDHLKNAKEEDLNNLLTLGEKLRDLVTVVLVCPSFQVRFNDFSSSAANIFGFFAASDTGSRGL